MQDTARWMILAGALLMAAGALVWLLGRLGFHGLPGDITYQSPRMRVYFPIVTCLVLSVLITAGAWLWQWLTRR